MILFSIVSQTQRRKSYKSPTRLAPSPFNVQVLKKSKPVRMFRRHFSENYSPGFVR